MNSLLFSRSDAVSFRSGAQDLALYTLLSPENRINPQSDSVLFYNKYYLIFIIESFVMITELGQWDAFASIKYWMNNECGVFVCYLLEKVIFRQQHVGEYWLDMMNVVIFN